MRCQKTLGLPYLLAAGTAATLAIKHGAFQAEQKDLDMQSIKCRSKTKQMKGGHKSRVGTRRAVSKRKCSANHRLSADHSLRSIAS